MVRGFCTDLLGFSDLMQCNFTIHGFFQEPKTVQLEALLYSNQSAIFLFRMVTYAKSKIWIEKLLKCLADGNEEINFEILVRPLEPFLVCKETKAALSRQKIFILTKPALVKAFQVKFSFDF